MSTFLHRRIANFTSAGTLTNTAYHKNKPYFRNIQFFCIAWGHGTPSPVSAGLRRVLPPDIALEADAFPRIYISHDSHMTRAPQEHPQSSTIIGVKALRS